MSLHAELMVDAAGVLADSHGEPGGLLLRQADGTELTVDVINLGETRLEPELLTEGSTASERQVEKTTVKVLPVTTAGESWTPTLAATCLLIGDERPWKIVQVGGLGTAFVKLDLSRPALLRQGRSGRFRGEGN